MRALHRILVLLHRSALSTALPAAATIAERSGATIRVLLHDERWTSDPLDPSPGSLKREAERSLARWLRGPAGETVTTVIRDGDPDEALAAEIEEWRPDLVIVNESHWEEKRARVGLLKVCVAHGHRPVLALPPSANPGDPLAVRRVVVALDGSALAEVGIERAVAFSRMLGAPLCLARVVPHAAPEATHWADAPKSLERRMVVREEAHAYLLGVAARLRADEINARVEVVAHADPVEGLLALAPGSLLVLTSHAREGLQRILLGSTATDVVARTTGPVLVVPPVVAPGGEERSATEVWRPKAPPGPEAHPA